MSGGNGKKAVVIVGGGAAAVTLIAQLEPALSKLPGYELVLVTARDYYFHLIAGLRANTSGTELAEQICVPYDKVFKHKDISRIVIGQVTEVQSDRLVLEDGQQIPFAYCVVATGKTWAAPNDVPRTRVAAIEQMKAYRAKIAAAKNIVILGGGAVGIEIASEIAATYPSDKKVTLVHKLPKLVNDTYNDKFRLGLQRQLLELGVRLHLGDAIEGEFDFTTTGPLDLTTKNGDKLEKVDLLIQSTGGSVNTGLLQNLVHNLITRSGVKVKPTFQLEGHDNIYAIGDVADLPEQKQAAKVAGHAGTAGKNILASINGQKVSANYKAPGEMIAINIADKGGMAVLTLPLFGQVNLGAWFVRTVKGKTLLVDMARKSLGY